MYMKEMQALLVIIGKKEYGLKIFNWMEVYMYSTQSNLSLQTPL